MKKYKTYILFLLLTIVVGCGFANIYGTVWNLFELPMKPWGALVSTILSLPSSVWLILWFDKTAGEL